MATFLITGPDGAQYQVDGENEEGALAALQQHVSDEQQPSWSELPGNILPSAKRMASGIYDAVSHPLQTVDNTGALISGGLGHAWNAVTPEFMNMTPGHDMQMASALAQGMRDRYGGMQNIRRTMIEDPVGALGDASMLLSGGAGAAARVPMLEGTMLPRALATAADVTNPFKAAAVAGKGVTKGAGYAASWPLSLTTGAPAEAIRESALSGYRSAAAAGNSLKDQIRGFLMGDESGKAFRDAMRGNTPDEAIIGQARDAMGSLADKRSAEYRANMQSTANSGAVVDTNPVRKALDELRQSLQVGFPEQAAGEGELASNAAAYAPLNKGTPAEFAKLDQMQKLLDEWESHPQGRTPIAMDALKQRYSRMQPNATDGNAANERRLVTTATNAVKDAIIEQVPEYRKAMGDYEAAMNLKSDLEKSLVPGSNVSPDTVINKLRTSMTNDRRGKLLEQLQDAGAPNLKSSIAGREMASVLPKGVLAKAVAMGGGNAAAWLNPLLLPLLLASSPRVVGEVGNKLGAAARIGEKVSPSAQKALIASMLSRALEAAH
ncbi:hypothetical protein [Aestuariivirga sp.]|uniref:hypothetical protein n=1 Tax=Aestuariivirga sp. TaxID=2650926 RepID=UPI0039E6D49B